MQFTIESTDPQSNARSGVIVTDHGDIPTPVFMPVGTAGTVKALHFNDLDEIVKAGIILGNTYHLYIRPGMDVIRQAGGLHRFNGWRKPILTDSGGYQVYSLADSRKLTENGVMFQSHIDGSRHTFTPESVIDIQRTIGADIIMAFDECPPARAARDYVDQSMQLTHRWLDRCFVRFNETEPLYGHDQALFPIVQGGVFKDLRAKSADYISSKNAGGNAIGGLSVGEPEEVMYEMTDLVCRILPADRPRYLMGVGTPVNLLNSIALGIDMFDCVMPTRNGRNGMVFTPKGIMNMKNEKWKHDFSPVDEDGIMPADRTCSKAYLRHLIISGEMLGAMMASLHNLTFYLWLMRQAREKIAAGEFSAWKDRMVKQLSQRL
ncbi:MAG: tRNA guanosine(34) transglycosylase Tgt [Bacteroidales bacterium]|jgi:queuine tRNA-ribosyltransferase|nr:tRNA guanosine(34) transglycosylase Tgt [Bacteroidales bacterium]